MGWAQPAFSRVEVDAAGHQLAEVLRGDQAALESLEVDRALDVVSNWRGSHSFPLNTFQLTLRKRARDVEGHPLVAQRLKRLPSMLFKLQRFPTMKLSQMQDIGGCRAILRSVANVRELRDAYAGRRFKHLLVREKNYVAEPKESGYRGVHLVYRYASDRKTTYNGLQIEMQLRSRIQHAWATAVETAGVFLEQSLKSSQGSEEWLRFFAMTSSAFAILERAPTVPNTPSKRSELKAWIAEKSKRLNVVSTLSAYRMALSVTEEPAHAGSYYFVLALKPGESSLTVRSYRAHELPRATGDYLETEKQLATQPGAQTVLVAAGSLEALRRAYPNYYLDAEVFLGYLSRVVG